jgi:glycosyltransferase involved in cell wall biosynthesis
MFMKIGFIDQATRGWTAGASYTRSMVHALRSKGSADAIVVLISGELCSFPRDDSPVPIANVKFLSKERILSIFQERGLDVLFPVSNPFEGLQSVPSVGWIPDFQHVFLPELFSSEEIEQRNQRFRDLARLAGAVVVSSEAAKRDFSTVLPEYAEKVEAVPFPSLLAYETWWQSRDPESTRRKYCLPERFVLVANQIWRHKNHQVVLDALAVLKSKGKPTVVVFTGAPSDYRVPRNAHLSDLLQRMSALNVRENIIFLGELPYEEVVDLYRRADVVLQPSRFEGWNTSLEDAKALGKRLVASNLEVHQEQTPEALFFDPLDPEELAAQIEHVSGLDPLPADHAEDALSRERELGAKSGARLLEIFGSLINARACHESPSAICSPPINTNGAPQLPNAWRSRLMGVYDRFVLPLRFDKQYYQMVHPAVAESLASGEFRDPMEHYLKVGRRLRLSYSGPRNVRKALAVPGATRAQLRDVAVALFLFNRPVHTSLVFNKIRKFAPTTLLIIGDGPRDEAELSLCDQARSVTENIDWPCRVLRNFAQVNLGCKKRLSSGLAWVFEHVEEAIILEDDCVPDASFFPFCSELLARYRNDHRIMHISGSCFLAEACTKDSYWFSRHSDIWGWATWRRAIRHYDAEMRSWPRWRNDPRSGAIWKDPFEREFWTRKFERTYRGEIDTWDYQWHWAVYRRQGLSVVPRRNLITNVGHGQQGSHTGDERSPLANLPTSPVEAKLTHPLNVTPDESADKQFFFARYVVANRMVQYHVPVAVATEPQRVIVAHDAPTAAQGVGALLCKVMRHEKQWISIRSRDCYLEHRAPAPSFRIDGNPSRASRLVTLKRTIAVLGDTPVTAVLAVPFSEQDCLNAISVHLLSNAPLAAWLMDDQNVFSPSISDAVLRELFERASVRLAICQEMKEAYEQKFGLPFSVQMPVENREDLVAEPLDIPRERAGKIVGCGNIWCENTLRRLMTFAMQGSFEIDWYGNLGRPRSQISDEELLAHNITAKGFLPHSALIARLRCYDFAIVPLADEKDERRAWQAKLSFPSKIITLAYAANLPLLCLGSPRDPGARFISERGLGEVSSWEPADYLAACEQLRCATIASRIRTNAARQALDFSADKVASGIWEALANRALTPTPGPYETVK